MYVSVDTTNFKQHIKLVKPLVSSVQQKMILWISIFLSISVVTTQPIDRNNRVGAFYYLLDFGYIAKDENTETAALMSDDVITKAIKDFQVSLAKTEFEFSR